MDSPSAEIDRAIGIRWAHELLVSAHDVDILGEMTLSVELPDSFARQLRLDGVQGQRRALEILALDGYRSGELSQGQVGELLSLSFQETEEFLNAHHAPPGLGPDEHLRGLRNLERAMTR